MKRKKLILVSVILVLCLLMASCSSVKSTGGDKEVDKSQGGISLPCEDDYIVDIKAVEEKLMLSTINVAEDFSASTATVWESVDEGNHWEKLFEEQFVSDDVGEIYINAEIHFVGQGGILQVFQWPKDNTKADYSKIYYLNDFENGLMEEVKTDYDMKNLGNTYFLSEDNLYGWDFMSGELLCLDLTKGTVQRTQLDDVDMLLDVVFNGPSAYVTYLSSANVYTGIKYDVLEQKAKDAPLFEAMIEEFGKKGYNMVNGVRFYSCIKENEEKYRYLCSDGVFEFDDSESKKISSRVPWSRNEEVDFRKADVISDEEILVYYTGLNGNNRYMKIDRIDLEENEY